MSDQQRFGAHENYLMHPRELAMLGIVLHTCEHPPDWKLFYTGDPLRLQGYVDMTDAPKLYPGMEPRNR